MPITYPNVLGPPFILPSPFSTIGSVTPDGRDGLAAPVVGPAAVNPSPAATTGAPALSGNGGLAQPVVGPQAVNPTWESESVNWTPQQTPPSQVATTYVDSNAARDATWAIFRIYNSGNGYGD